MLKSIAFEQVFTKIKDYLPDITIREKVKSILEEHDILTQEQLQVQLKQIERMRSELAALEERISKIEQKKSKK